jgi:hypothetical protein
MDHFGDMNELADVLQPIFMPMCFFMRVRSL